jgi:MFS family permease
LAERNGGITTKKKLSLKQIIIVLALSLVHLNIMADNVIIPVAGNLFQDFPNANINVFNFILSGSSLVGGVSCLVFGKLMDRFAKKKLMIVAFVIFMIGGICGDLIHTAEYIAVMRALVGIGMGALNGIAVAFISDLFVDEEHRSSAMGIFSAMQAAIGTILSYASGALAVNNWTTVFRIYLVAIPALFILIFLVPNDKAPVLVQEAKESIKEKIDWKKLIPLDLSFAAITTLHYAFFYQLSLVFAEKGIEDLGVIGIATALVTVGGFLLNLGFGRIYMKLKRITPVFLYGFMALSYVMLIVIPGVPMAMIASFIAGAAMGVSMSYYYMYCTVIVPPSRVPISVSITTTTMYVACFFAPYITTALQSIIGVVTILEVMPVLTAALAVGAILSLVLSLRDRKSNRVVE